MAKRAYDYIVCFFEDKEYGGYFWSVDATGKPLKTRKQVYAQAFVIYAFSEYYKATGQQEVLDKATALFNLLERYSYDTQYGGYFEAYTREWQLESDLRLSDKDENTAKSMNTHLHIIEGYAALYRIYPQPLLKARITELLEDFDQHIIDPTAKHLRLFFNADWQQVQHIDSYGHDIEAAWLLQEAAEIIKEESWIRKTKESALMLVAGAEEGLDADGGLWYEKDKNRLVKEKHWWSQAEAMVGFYNAYQITGEDAYYQHAANSWLFIQNKLLDRQNGEWYWGLLENNTLMYAEDKAGFWKCPYHNSRACLELVKRFNHVFLQD